MADENKNEYAAQLQNFNGEQHKHFYIVIPQIYKVKCRYEIGVDLELEKLVLKCKTFKFRHQSECF